VLLVPGAPLNPWTLVPQRSGCLLVHVRALHLPTSSAFVDLGRALCRLDRDGRVTLTGERGAHVCRAEDLEATTLLLRGTTDVVTVAGTALSAGPWQVLLSARPARPSQIRTARDDEAFAQGLAALVARHAHASTVGDLVRRRPLIPG
jgi:hypothetical protein